MRKHPFIATVICFVFTSCASYYSHEVEQVMRLAGRNRAELEKVLKHYGKDPADSLRLRAAEFLIANMPGKYSKYYDAPWNDVATVRLRWTSSSEKQQVLDTYRIGNPVSKPDIEHISADYLINNIDLAFKVWQEVPWGKQISFDVFCEEILPYRVEYEPLENWREKVLSSFADIYSSFTRDTNMTSVEACSKVNDLLPRFRLDKDFPWMSYSQLMASTRGTCDHMAALTVFVMRGLGIPVTFDYTPKWTDGSTGHSWNSVTNSESGAHISFMGTESNPGQSHQGTTLRKAKAYRKLYANQTDFDRKPIDMPPLLHNIDNIIDVTSETEYCIDIWGIKPKVDLKSKEKVFLAIPDNMEWLPIGWGEYINNGLEFRSVKRGLYLPVRYSKDVLFPVGNPFRVDHNGCHFYFPYSSNTQAFIAVSPMDYTWLHQMEGGKFEAANRSDFSDAQTLCTITTSGLGYNSISVTHSGSYRYVRYIPQKGFPYNVSELEFYDIGNEKIKGTLLEIPGAQTADGIDKPFDGDVSTFYSAVSGSPPWIGLDFGKPCKISKIRYLPRTDGNGIYEGHEYELLYWDGERWASLGKKTAASHVLQYEVPGNVLLYLKNLTLNKMHSMPFVIEYDEQKWL